MTWGAEESSLRDFEQETGLPSKALDSKPSLNPRLTYYYDEFNDLASDRTLDQGYPTALTTAQIREYCDFFSVQDRLEFRKYIKMIDHIYLTEFYKRQKAKDAK